MRILKINNELCDIDEQTSIGIDLQAYDIRTPGIRKTNVSNNFSIPKTDNNWRICGLFGHTFSQSLKVYEPMTVYYQTGENLIYNNERCRIVSVSKDRIELLAVAKIDFSDRMKEFKWGDLSEELGKWLKDEKGYKYNSSTNATTWTNYWEDTPIYDGQLDYYITTFPERFTNATEGVIIPFAYGNLYNVIYNVEGDGFSWQKKSEYSDFIYGLISHNTIYDSEKNEPYKAGEIYNGGHTCIFIKTLFEFIEYKFNVDLGVTKTFDGNIFNDIVFNNLYTPVRDLMLTHFVINPADDPHPSIWSFCTCKNYYPEITDNSDKTLYDFFDFVCKVFNIIIDKVSENNYNLYRMDDIASYGDVIDWSGIEMDSITVKPFIEGQAIKNNIVYKNIYDGGGKLSGGKQIVSENKNLDNEVTLLEVDGYVGDNIVEKVGNSSPKEEITVLNLSDKKCFNSFVLLSNSEQKDCHLVFYNETGINIVNFSLIWYYGKMNIPSIYSLDSEYKSYENYLKYPQFVECTKWISIRDILNLKYFRIYYIKELGGGYFLNKISGFNPDESKEPTKLELIRISDRSPNSPIERDYYTDGIGVEFTDGNANKYY